MKKILQINIVVNTGSTGRIAEDIGKEAIVSGFKSYIAYGRSSNESKSNLIKIGNGFSNWIHVFKTRVFDKHGLGSSFATKAFIRKIMRIKPDIIHIHNIHGYYLNIEIFFEFLINCKIPVVWTMHDCWAFTGHCTYFDYVGCEKWKTKCSKCLQKNSYPKSVLFDRSEKNFELKKYLFTKKKELYLVPVSNWLGGIVKQSFLSEKYIEVIHNGIDTSVFRPTIDNQFRTKHNLRGKFIVLGVASSWTPRKGLKDFIKLNRLLGKEFVIVLVGLSSKQINHLPNDIMGIQRTENITQLIELYTSSDVFVNPTYEDNFPTTNIEAMSCGTPVITYNTGGSPEAIDLNTGIVVEKGNIDSLFIAIRKVKKNGKLFYRNACIDRVTNLYNKDERYKGYLRLYNKIVNS